MYGFNMDAARWRTSSRSGANGNCVEIGAKWRTSSRSGGNGNCVEVADNLTDAVAVRDSKDRSGPVLTFSPAAWRAFAQALKGDEITA